MVDYYRDTTAFVAKLRRQILRTVPVDVDTPVVLVGVESTGAGLFCTVPVRNHRKKPLGCLLNFESLEGDCDGKPVMTTHTENNTKWSTLFLLVNDLSSFREQRLTSIARGCW